MSQLALVRDYVFGDCLQSSTQRLVKYEIPEQVEETDFRNLFDQWYAETSFSSSIHDMMDVPSFKKIVDAGEDAIPAIIDEISQKPSLLMLAARQITGEDPVTESIRGDIRAMAGAWIGWYSKAKQAWI